MPADRQRTLQIFISSPGDVVPERRRAQLIIETLAKSYSAYFDIKPIVWEVEPMLASGHFQDQIIPPDQTDIVVLIVWSRLGTALPPKTDIREYRGFDDRVPVTGTEWEFESALAGQKAHGAPDLLAYRKQAEPIVSLRDKAAKALAEEQWDRLNEFWNRWFVNRGEFRAAFSEFSDLDGFAAKLESDLKNLIERRIDALKQGGETGATWHQGNPYRGLHGYRFADAPIFFGRTEMATRAVEQLTENADAGRAFLLILGASGTGKSSLAQAGVLPALTGRGIVPGLGLWRRAVMRPAGHPAGPFMALAEALVAQDALPELQALGHSTDALARHFQAAGDPAFAIVPALNQIEETARKRGELLKFESARLVLLVDQFEELFVSVDLSMEERAHFVSCIDGLSRSGRVSVLATMRSDHWHHAAATPQLVQMAAGRGRLDLIPPGRDEIFEMIRQPAAAAGLAFGSDPAGDIGLDASLANEAAGEPGALPLLSFLLEELYKRDIRDGARILTYESVQALGGLRGAIAARANAVYLAQPRDVQAALPDMLRALVTVSRAGGAPAARLAPMTRFTPGSPERKLVDALLDPEVRLLVADGDGEGARVRLAHEALMTHWDLAARLIAREGDDLRTRTLVEDALAEWRKAPPGRRRKYRLREPLLSAAVDLARRWKAEFNAEARGFIASSYRWARLVFHLTVAAAVVFAAVAVAAAALGEMARRSQIAAERAQSQVLANLAEQRLQDGDSVTAMLLALAGLPDAQDAPSRPYEASDERALFMARQGAREALVLPYHAGAVRGAAFSPDGKLIVTVSDDRTARLWDAASGRVIDRHLTLAAGLRSVAFSPDGKTVAIGSFDRQARAILWNIEGGGQPKQLSGHRGPVRGIAFSRDGKLVATASDDHRAGLWNAVTGENIRFLPHDDIVRSVAFSPDGRQVATGSQDWIVRIWDVNGSEEPRLLRGHGDWVLGIAFSPTGNRFVTASADKTAIIWDATSYQVVHVLQGHAAAVLSAAFSPDGNVVLTASEDGTIRLWNAGTGQQIAILRGHAESVSSAAYSPDGRRIVSASYDRTARVWSVEPDAGVRALGTHAATVRSVSFSRDGKRLVTASDDMTAGIWDVDSGRQIGVLRAGAAVRSAAFSPDGKRIATVADDGIVSLWDADTGGIIRRLKEDGAVLRSVAFSPDSKRIVTVLDDGTARVWDADRGAALYPLKKEGAELRSAAFSHDGNRIVTASDDKAAQLWDAQTGNEIGQLSGGHRGELVSAEFSPDDRLVVTASADDFTARIWDAQTRGELRVLKSAAAVNSATFSADSRRVVTASNDGLARAWDVASGQEIAVLPKQKAAILAAVFGPDGRRVALATDKQVLLWSVFPDTQSLVAAAKARAPRCLAPAQRPFAACPPAWCFDQAKWPYHVAEEWKDWRASGCSAASLPTAEAASQED